LHEKCSQITFVSVFWDVNASNVLAVEPDNPAPASEVREGFRGIGPGMPALPADLPRLWHELTHGLLTVTAHQNTDTRHYVEFSRRSNSDPCALHPRTVVILERFLLGESQKSIAINMHLSTATVSGLLRTGVALLGLEATPRLMPMFLAVLAHAARGRIPPDSFDARRVDTEHGGCLLILNRPDCAISHLLSRGERYVVRALLDGCTHAEIARMRATSARTIANQMARAFAKLGVSGRLQLVCHVLSQHSPNTLLEGSACPSI
jgi:DNA-binding NarL/FixJ family response regulator